MENSFVIAPFIDFPNGEALCMVDEFEHESASIRKHGGTKKELYFQNKESICYAAISVHEGEIVSCRFLSGQIPDEWYSVFFENLEFFRQNQNMLITPDIFQEIPVLYTTDGRLYHREKAKKDLMILNPKNFVFRIAENAPGKSKFLFYTSGSVYPYALATIKGNVLTNYNLLPPKKQEDLTVNHLNILSQFCQEKNVRLSETMLKSLAVAQDQEKNLFFTTELPGDKFFDEVFFTKEPVTMPYYLHAKKVVIEGIPFHKMPVFMPETETLELRRVTELEYLLTNIPNLRHLTLKKVPHLKHIEPDIFVRAKQGKISFQAGKCPSLRYPVEPKILGSQQTSESQEKEE